MSMSRWRDDSGQGNAEYALIIVVVLAAFYVVMNIITDVIALLATPRRRIAR